MDDPAKLMPDYEQIQYIDDVEDGELNFRHLKATLYYSIDTINVTLLNAILKQIKEHGFALGDEVFRHNETGFTPLRYAISLDRDEAITSIMRFQGQDLLFERYDYDKTDLLADGRWTEYAEESYLTCVHLLVEKAKVEAVKALLRVIPLKTEEDIRTQHAFLSCPVYRDIGKRYDQNISTHRMVSCLHIAASLGLVELIDALAKRNINPDIMFGDDFCYLSPLAITVECNKVAAFRKLAGLSKLFNAPSLNLQFIASFLKIATAAGSSEIVLEVVQMAKDNKTINTSDFQDAIESSINDSIGKGFTHITDMLNKCVSPGYSMKSPLREAIKAGQKEVVEELLAKGAKVDENSIMDCIIHEKTNLLIDLLPKAPVVPEDFWKGVAAAKDEFARQAFDSYSCNKKAQEKLEFTNHVTSPLHIAATHDKVYVLKCFLKLGCDINNVDDRGNLLTHIAAQHNSVNVIREHLHLFDPNVPNDDGDTVLLIASKRSRPKIIQLLMLEPLVNWMHKNNAGDTALHIAVRQLSDASCKDVFRIAGGGVGDLTTESLPTREERVETLTLLAAKFAEKLAVDEVDANGNTALSLLVQAGRNALMHLFAKSDPTILNSRNRSAVDYAMDAYENNESLIENIMRISTTKAATYLSKVYRGEKAPLFLFAKHRDLTNVRFMVQNGADVTEQDEDGCSIFHALINFSVEDENYAQEYIEIARIIIEEIANFRIKRQQEIYHYLSANLSQLENTLSSNSLNSTSQNYHAMAPMSESDISNSGTKKNKASFGKRPFVTCPDLSPFDVKRLLFLYLTRLLKNREGQTVLNYAIYCKAQNFLKFLLEVRERVSNTPDGEYTVPHPLKQLNLQFSKAAILASQSGSHDQTRSQDDDNDDEDLEKKTMFVIYDVTYLTSETRKSVYIQDCDWIDAALQEEYLYDVFRCVSNNTLDSHLAKELDETLFKKWNINEIFSVWSLLELPALQRKSFLTRKKSKTMPRKKSGKDPSALETIVEMDDQVTAAAMLNISPLSQLVESYWSLYRWLYFFIMTIHIFFMSVFSWCSIPTAYYEAPSFEATTQQEVVDPCPNCRIISSVITSNKGQGQSLANSAGSDNAIIVTDPWETCKMFALFLIYPLIFLLVSLYLEILNFIAYIRKRRIEKSQSVEKKFTLSSKLAGLLDWPYYIIDFLLECMSTVSCIVFTVCICLWYMMLLELDSDRNYYLSVCLIVGWLLTINYTRGFQSLHSFKNIMKSIVLSDMLRFFMVYIFILVGFTLGFQVLLPLIKDDRTKPNAADSLFLNLRNFLSPIDALELEYFDVFSNDSAIGGIYVKIAFLIFSFLMGLILINILIAMMNDSYTKVNENEQITFRVGSLRQSMSIFRGFPMIQRLKEMLMRGDDTQVVRYSIIDRGTVALFNLRCEVKVVDGETSTTVDMRLDNIERHVKEANANIGGLAKQIEAINEAQVDTRLVLAAMMSKLEDCTKSVKALTGTSIRL